MNTRSTSSLLEGNNHRGALDKASNRNTDSTEGKHGKCTAGKFHRLEPDFRVRREKGASLQWEEAIPPGNCRSSRKQPERS